jgi:hypothetical protein
MSNAEDENHENADSSSNEVCGCGRDHSEHVIEITSREQLADLITTKGAELTEMRVRTINDEEGEEYLNGVDLARALMAVLNYGQLANTNMVYDEPDAARLLSLANSVLANTTRAVGGFVIDDARKVKAPSVDDIPDTLPEDWS